VLPRILATRSGVPTSISAMMHQPITRGGLVIPFRGFRVAIIALMLFGGLIVAPSAQGATPGPNGLIAFTSATGPATSKSSP
jgi:hypothetical protein